MNRQIACATAAIAVLFYTVANASPEKVSAQACASAFASSIAAPGAGAPSYKFAFRGSVDRSVADFYSRDYSFTLEARDLKTGSAIARARCTADSHGTVTAIAAMPLVADAKPAAQL